MREYALYKGDFLLCMGTISEIAEHQGVSEKTIRFYGSKAHKRRGGKNYNNQKILICLD